MCLGQAPISPRIRGARAGPGQPLASQREPACPASRSSTIRSSSASRSSSAPSTGSRSPATAIPRYNIEQRGENGIRITLALAGFSAADLSVHVEDNQLVVRGRQEEPEDRVYLHRGIAARQFQRSFVLADGLEVTGATLDNGLLNIDLERPPAATRVRRIEIRDMETPARKPGGN